jgi:hypothetical protein
VLDYLVLFQDLLLRTPVAVALEIFGLDGNTQFQVELVVLVEAVPGETLAQEVDPREQLEQQVLTVLVAVVAVAHTTLLLAVKVVQVL